MPGARPVEHGFDPAWLRRREPLDRAARAGALARGFAAAILAGPDGVRRVVDLAAGAGANFRALAPLLDGDQDWTLVDHDARLLDEQARAIAHWARDAGWHVDSHPTGCLIDTGRARWRVRRADVDLARDLERVSLEDFDAVTCAAFLDLVSDAWIVRLCAWLARSPCPLLAVLTVDGRRVWSPADPSDADVQASFARHQRGDRLRSRAGRRGGREPRARVGGDGVRGSARAQRLGDRRGRRRPARSAARRDDADRARRHRARAGRTDERRRSMGRGTTLAVRARTAVAGRRPRGPARDPRAAERG
ncbi:MAG: class I SAM-dependent methyltransferase [Burkholderiaceae bacterium]